MASAYLHCQKCLISRSGDVLGQPCKTQGCDGVIEQVPAFSTLVDDQPESFFCRRRGENPLSSRLSPGPDCWQKFKTNGNRVCSYCGSLHPEDMFALVKASAEAPEDAPYRSVVAIEPSDKGYKVYVHQPGVRNAGEGGIKFYMQHCPRDENDKIAVTDQQQMEYAEAVRRTTVRFQAFLDAQFPRQASA